VTWRVKNSVVAMYEYSFFLLAACHWAFFGGVHIRVLKGAGHLEQFCSLGPLDHIMAPFFFLSMQASDLDMALFAHADVNSATPT